MNIEETTYCRPVARNADKPMSWNETVKHFKGLKGKSYAQEEAKRADEALGENDEVNILQVKICSYTINTRILLIDTYTKRFKCQAANGQSFHQLR